MKDIQRTGTPRKHEEAFRKIDIKTYAQRVFSMYVGTPARITLLCDMRLLDVMIERFGLKSAVYQKVDDAHFSVSTKVEVSEQFFGWLTGFGTKVKLTDDSKMDDGTSVAEDFKKYLGEIMEQYEEVSRL